MSTKFPFKFVQKVVAFFTATQIYYKFGQITFEMLLQIEIRSIYILSIVNNCRKFQFNPYFSRFFQCKFCQNIIEPNFNNFFDFSYFCYLSIKIEALFRTDLASKNIDKNVKIYKIITNNHCVFPISKLVK